MPMGMSFWGSRASRAAGNGIESDISEEDGAGAHHDSAQSELTESAGVHRQVRGVIRAMDERPPHADEDDHHGQLDDHNQSVGAGRFLDPHHQQHRDQKHDDHCREIGRRFSKCRSADLATRFVKIAGPRGTLRIRIPVAEPSLAKKACSFPAPSERRNS